MACLDERGQAGSLCHDDAEEAWVHDHEGGCGDLPEGDQNLVVAPDVDASFLVQVH